MTGESVNLETLTADDFKAQVGEPFRMRLSEDQWLDLVLLEVHTHTYAPPAAQKRRGFSVLFESNRPGAAPQGTYVLANEKMGTMDVFIVPVGPRKGGMSYEVVFN